MYGDFIKSVKREKSGQATYIAPLQPLILALFPAWGSLAGAGRIRLAQCKNRNYLLNCNVILNKILFPILSELQNVVKNLC